MTPKQARFVEEYLIDLNATQAAIRAGYTAKRADAIGYENLLKPEIQQAVQTAMRERSAQTGITAERVLREIARIAFADPRRVMSWGPVGVVVRDSSELTDEEAAIVSEVSETRKDSGGSIRIKLNDKLAALEKLARHTNVYGDFGEKTIVIERSYGAP